MQILAERAAQPPPAASVASCVPAPPQRGYLSSSSDALGESLPSVAAIAAHPPLYNVVSFRNVPMWVGANTPLWNAYRVASERGDRAAQVRAVLDILLLPSFVLSRTGRGGRGAAQRKARTINARCRSRVAAAVQRYGRTVPYESNGEVQAIAGPPAARSRQPAASRVSIATTDSDDNECTAPAVRRQTATKAVSSRTRSSVQRLFEQPGDDQDVDAVNSAKRLVTEKQIRRAAQRLHSTTAMVDLTDATVRAELVSLHPPLPEGAMIPARPGGTSPIILEDDDDMRRLLRSSNNGSAGGPSGWAGNMLSSLVESALCRAGIITLLSDIVNNNLPDQARQYLLSSRLVGLSKPDSGVARAPPVRHRSGQRSGAHSAFHAAHADRQAAMARSTEMRHHQRLQLLQPRAAPREAVRHARAIRAVQHRRFRLLDAIDAAAGTGRRRLHRVAQRRAAGRSAVCAALLPVHARRVRGGGKCSQRHAVRLRGRLARGRRAG